MTKLTTPGHIVATYGLPHSREAKMFALGFEPGCTLVFTNGCFDVLHPGHIALLEHAKNLGSVLIVGLNSDVSLRGLKGDARPVIDEAGRVTMLSALSFIDHIILFDDPTPEKLIEMIVPDTLVKGGDYAGQDIVGARFVFENGGDVELAPLTLDPRTGEPYSTSKIIVAGA